MAQDIVDAHPEDTSSRGFIPKGLLRRGFHLLSLLVFALLLVACVSGGNGNGPATKDVQPSVIVETVQLPNPTSTPVPTSTPEPTVTPTPTPPAPLAAMVNGQYIFLEDYERQVAQFEQSLLAFGVDLSTEEGQARLAQARVDILEGLINEVLIAQGGAALGVALADADLDAQVEADIEAGGGQAAFDEWLASSGQTSEDYKEMLRRSLISQRVWELVTADVPDAVEQIHARIIVVGSQEEAQDVLTLLQQGGDFVTLAREKSLDEATKDNGGDLDWFPRGLVDLELENAAFGLQPGGVSDPVLIGDRYYVIQVVEREEARPLLPDLLLHLKQSKFDQWLEELRIEAVIERFAGE